MDRKLLLLIILAAGMRLGFAAIYPPRTFPDTVSYVETGRQLVSGDYTGYNGRRTPVYPLFLAASGFDYQMAVLLQSALGILISVLLYYMFISLAGNPALGFWAGLSYALNPSQVLTEFALGSETLCTFLLMLSLYFLFRIIRGHAPPGWSRMIVLGLITGLCILTRPQFQILLVLIPLYLAWELRDNVRRMILKPALFLLPAMILLLSWMGFQHHRIGQFRITPDLGAAVMNHAIKFIEFAPDSYQEIKDILIRNRQIKLETRGEAYGSVALTYNELQRTTELTYPQVADTLGQVAIAAIKEKPFLYLKSVFRGFVRFFKPYWPGRLWGIRDAVERGGWPLKILAASYAAFQLVCMGLFLIFPLVTVFWKASRAFFRQKPQLVFIYGLVLATAASQALVEFGENARYKASVEPLMIAVAVAFALQAVYILAGKTDIICQE